MPVVLATDILVWLLLFTALGYGFHCQRQPHLAVAWQRVFRSPAAVASTVVLIVFLAIAVLDSLHYRPMLETRPGEKAAYATEVFSVLDLPLSGLKRNTEKTYSAPLATRSFAKEQVELPGGKVGREFPRLRFGGAHLEDEGEWAEDVTRRVLAGSAAAALLCVFAALGLRRLRRWRPQIPWHAALAALGVLLFIAGPVAALSLHYHVLGTDKVGQDILYLALKSVRTSVVIGTLTTLVLLPMGIVLGIMAGYYKSWIDDAIQYVYTTLNSIPSVLLIAASVLMVQVYVETHPDLFQTAAQRADFRLLMLCIIMGLTSWTGLARVLRGETLKLSQLEYVQAAQAFGVREGRILSRHILPNVAHIVIITLALDFSGFVLAEAVLSYIGVGVDPATNSFGTMINAARLEMSREPVVWWALATAFTFMFVLVLAANLFADAVRDGFDPRTRV
jgi:peptide/nickel transport system permease protein